MIIGLGDTTTTILTLPILGIAPSSPTEGILPSGLPSGYAGISTVNAPTTSYEIGYGIGQWVSNNLLWIGLGLGGLLLLKGRR
jgi:hypothetical protein